MTVFRVMLTNAFQKSAQREQREDTTKVQLGERVNLLSLFTGVGLKVSYIPESQTQCEQWNKKAGTLNLIVQVKDCSGSCTVPSQAA